MVHGAEVRFFIGGTEQERADEVMLEVPDDYLSLPLKVRAAFRWALDHGYDYVFKTDDDVYINPIRLLREIPQHDYVGTLSSGESESPYASGFAYWVSRRAMDVLSTAAVDDWAEDRWTGTTLHRAGIGVQSDDRFKIIKSLNAQNLVSGTEGPRAGNNIVAVAELEPAAMRRIHMEGLNLGVA